VGSYPTVSPLPDPRRLDWGPIALAIGGLFSVVPVSDRSAWVLPSALPMKSGLSSRYVAATSGHPVFSLAQIQYRKRMSRMQGPDALPKKGSWIEPPSDRIRDRLDSFYRRIISAKDPAKAYDFERTLPAVLGRL
jgi:hypothetical protein